jgi:hypothetical protein
MGISTRERRSRKEREIRLQVPAPAAARGMDGCRLGEPCEWFYRDAREVERRAKRKVNRIPKTIFDSYSISRNMPLSSAAFMMLRRESSAQAFGS